MLTISSTHPRTHFEELYAELQPELVRYARRHLGSAASEAEDVVQEAFIRLHRSLTDNDAPAAAGPWLYTSVRWRALDVHDRRGTCMAQRHCTTLEDAGVNAWRAERTCEDEVLDRAEAHAAMRDVASLSDRRREVLVRLAINGEAPDAVASDMGTSPGAAAVLLHRARAEVRARREERTLAAAA
jgi:RNA polymerase sigma-70 factor (ECF subfamily)